MPLGSLGVTDHVNTTSGEASGVVAAGGVGSLGVVEQFAALPVDYIATESNDRIDAEDGDNLITQ